MSTKELAFSKIGKTISIPNGIKVEVVDGKIIVKGTNAELQKEYPSKLIEITTSDGKIEIKPKTKTAFVRMLVGTYASHIKNMIAGVQKPFVYTLKIVFTHFPISVVVTGSELQIQNFLGEKKPRKVTLPQGVKVSVQNDLIKVESADIELAGKTASLIENATRITGRDRRIFQDGIYIVQKGK
jgi:large subunit ribosomal protein L6